MHNSKHRNMYLLQISSDPVLTVVLHVGRFSLKPGINTCNDLTAETKFKHMLCKLLPYYVPSPNVLFMIETKLEVAI